MGVAVARGASCQPVSVCFDSLDELRWKLGNAGYRQAREASLGPGDISDYGPWVSLSEIGRQFVDDIRRERSYLTWMDVA